MSDITDMTGDLDSYGVWEKRPPRDINADAEQRDAPSDTASNIDLPDFSDLDTSLTDMTDFDIPQTDDPSVFDFPTSDESEADSPLLDGNDTSLTIEELSNITENLDMIMEEAGYEDVSDDFDVDAINMDDGESALPEATRLQPKIQYKENTAEPIDTPDAVPEEQAEITEPEVTDEITDVTDEFNFDAIEDVTESFSSDSSSLEAQPDGEISIDDFFSDDSTPPAGSDDGSVDLSDFLGDDDFSTPAKSKSSTAEEIVDEKTLDIDIAFDDNADDIILEEEQAPQPAETQAETHLDLNAFEETSVENMFASFDNAAGTASSGGSSLSADDTEMIDLSEFGIDDDDSNIGMTDTPDDAGPVRKETVDYDMTVSVDDDTNDKVSMADVISGNISYSVPDSFDEETASLTGSDDMENTQIERPTPVSPEISEKGKEILEQIVSELASLKDEIRNLKTDFAELKTKSAEMPVATIEANESEGFFADDGTDDTISLSGDELDNILSNADFSTEDEPAVSTIEEPEDGMLPPPSVTEDELVMPDEAGITAGSEPVPHVSTEETEAVQDAPLQDPVIDTENADNPTTIDDMFSTEDLQESDPDDLTMDFDEENLEAPQLDTFDISSDDIPDEGNEFEISDELPEEISIPRPEDDILVESSSTDLMDSITNTDDDVSGSEPEDQISTVDVSALDEFMEEDISISDSLTDEKMNYLSDSSIPEVDIAEIMNDNSTGSSDDNIGVSLNSDINAAFDEAESEETAIIDDELEQQEIDTQTLEDVIESTVANDFESIIQTDDTDTIEETMPEFSTEPVFETIDEPVLENTVIEQEQAVEDSSVSEEPVDIEEPLISDAPESADITDIIDFSDVVDEENQDELLVSEPAFEENEITETIDIPETEISEPSVDEITGDMTVAADDVPAVEMDEPEIEDTAIPAYMPSIDETVTSADVPLDETSMAADETAVVMDEPEVAVQDSEGAVPDYEGIPEESTQAKAIPEELKSEIKTVLSYMDQLLEDLPEEKISEFARSEHFETYKKLFKELGLS